MFLAMGYSNDTKFETMIRNFQRWVARLIGDCKYLGLITEVDGRPVASAGLLILDWPPHLLDPAGERRGYVLNVFVESEYRRRGLASSLIERCLAEARRRSIRVVALHASDAARHVYEAFGFRESNEMRYVEPLDEKPESARQEDHGNPASAVLPV